MKITNKAEDRQHISYNFGYSTFIGYGLVMLAAYDLVSFPVFLLVCGGIFVFHGIYRMAIFHAGVKLLLRY